MEVKEDNEALIIVKTRLDIFSDLVEAKKNHIMRLPE